MRNALFLILLAGCTRPNVNDSGVPYLDGPVRVTAQGTRPRSSVSMTRAGALDPTHGAMEVMVNDADVQLHVKDGRATLDHIKLILDSVDLPPSPDLPHGLALRDTYLALENGEPVRATIEEQAPDALTLRAEGALMVHSSMVLADGTLYPLGAIPTEAGELTVRVTLDGDKATATLDSTPPATCWTVGAPDNTLLQAQNCAVFVESFAKVDAL
jgi:hypothetical protein